MNNQYRTMAITLPDHNNCYLYENLEEMYRNCSSTLEAFRLENEQDFGTVPLGQNCRRFMYIFWRSMHQHTL
jgi:hypothetical protein